MLLPLLRLSRPPSFRSVLFASVRRYATPSTNVPPSPPPRPSPAKVARAVTRRRTVDADNYKKLNKAEALFNANHELLYRAPKRLTTFRIQSWFLASACVGYLSYSLYYRLNDYKAWKERDHPYPKFLAAANVATNMIIIAAGYLFIYRVGGHIHSIQLVKRLDQVFMQVTTRSRFPFLKKHVVAQPYNFRVGDSIVHQRRVPDWMLTRDINESSPSAAILSVIINTARAVPRLVHNMFTSVWQLVAQEGIVHVALVDENSAQIRLSMDVEGQYLRDGQSDALWDIVTITSRSRLYDD